MELLHVGFGGTLVARRIVAICDPDTSPIQRMVRVAKAEGRAIDLTYGRRTNTVIILDTGQVALAALQPETIVNRLRQSGGSKPNPGLVPIEGGRGR